jgi:hypothetical protein
MANPNNELLEQANRTNDKLDDVRVWTEETRDKLARTNSLLESIRSVLWVMTGLGCYVIIKTYGIWAPIW